MMICNRQEDALRNTLHQKRDSIRLWCNYLYNFLTYLREQKIKQTLVPERYCYRKKFEGNFTEIQIGTIFNTLPNENSRL
jgi:hypothetical protein